MNFIMEGDIIATVPILIACLFSLIIIAIVATRGIKHKRTHTLLCDGLLIIGLLSFSYPIFLLIIGLFQAADAVIQAGEISASLVWKGIQHSLISITMGLVTLHISVIGWFVIRRFKTQ